jgi:hypothetical protein
LLDKPFKVLSGVINREVSVQVILYSLLVVDR